MTALIQIENLHYRPESLETGKPAILRDISLTIKEGQFIAIVGRNGSGKTTLIKHINGLLLPSSGQVIVDGMDTRQPENWRRLRGLVGMVFQDPADQIVASTVEEDVAFGLENLNLPTEEIRRRVSEQLAAAGLSADRNRPPHLLSGGQIQKLALAGVLARNPKIILFDEPTSMLDVNTREAFLKRICQLHDQGMTIIYVTHHMEEVVYADQVVILDSGRVVNSDTPQKTFQNVINLREWGVEKPEVVDLAERLRALGWNIDQGILTPDGLIAALPAYESDRPLRSNKSSTLDKKATSTQIIEMHEVKYTYLSGTPLAKMALDGVDFSVKKNAIHGIAGNNGSGKSTLLQHINGILRSDKGQITVKSLQLDDPETLLRDVIRLVGLVFQSPENQFFEIYVGDEIAFGPKQFGMEDLRDRVRKAMEQVGLDFDALKDRRLETLSGGEKRKVALASTLVLDQEIMLFDEPTAGMDPNARDELLKLFKRLKESGKTIVIASHRMEELAGLSGELSLMQAGQVIHSGNTPETVTDYEKIKKIGLSPPLSARVAHALQQKSWPISIQDGVTPEKLVNAIREVEK